MATDLERLIVQVDAKLTGLENAMRKASGVTDKRMREIESRTQTMTRRIAASTQDVDLGAALGRGLATAGITVGLDRIVRAVGEAATAYVDLQNKLRVAGFAGAEVGAAFERLMAIAQRQGAAIGPLVDLYAKLSGAQQELGASNAQLERFTEGVAIALRVAGTDSQAASGALLQLSQSLGGGVVRAEEFNSVLEGARPILVAVAAGLQEAGGSVSTLRGLVNDGKVSAEAFFDAFLAGLPLIESQAAAASGTVGQAVNRIENAFIALVGRLDEATGASSNAAANLGAVADAIGSVGQYVDSAVAALATLEAALGRIGNSSAWAYIFGTPNAADAKAAGLTPLNMPGMTAEDQAKASLIKSLSGGQTAGAAGATDWRYGPGTGLPEVTLNGQIKPVSLASYPVPGAKTGGGRSKGGGGKSEAEKEAEAVRKTVEEYRFKAEQLSRTAAQQELYEELQRAGVTLESDNGRAIEVAVTAYQKKRAEIEATEAAQESLNDTMQFFGDAAVDSLSALIENGGDAEDVIRRLAVRLAQAAAQAVLLGQGPLAGLFGTAGGANGGVGGLIGTLFGAFTGKAAGGAIAGPGTGTSDSIPIMASNGEFIVRAAQARKFRPLLDAINSGRVGHFAAGGSIGATVPAMPHIPGPRELAAVRGGASITYAPQIDARGADAAAVARLEQAMARDRAAFAANVVKVVGDARSRRVV